MAVWVVWLCSRGWRVMVHARVGHFVIDGCGGRGGGRVAQRLLVDLGAEGSCSVLWLRDELPELVTDGQELVWPLDGRALEDLRWYLEDYLRAPFGVWEDRGPAIRAQLASWGDAVFGSLFAGGPARDAFQRARDDGLELVFRSESPQFLGLPWELMRGPDGPVALSLAGVSRALRTKDLARTAAVAGGRLRVLMVISRPAGAGDVGYQMVARPLLERLEAVRGQVDLVVLRPPTLDALREVLAEAKAAGEPFQVVHFDGHGVMPDRPVAGTGMRRPVMMTAAGAEGLLAFEKPAGGDDLVTASKFSAVLHDAGVPVVVLNACQSGAVGKDLEAAVATRLLREGCAAVVAMAYSVYAVAAAEFMAVFYERLFAGDTVSAAVTAGRRRLFEHDGRPSPKGEMPLADWVVPVHYLRRDVAFPQAETARPVGAPSLEDMLDDLRRPADGDAGGAEDLAAVGEFVGRDDLLYELEAAARSQKVIVLHGPGGAGKTEAAKAFGRWWRDTGGVDQPQWVLWQSFEPGVASFGLDAIITQVGLAVFGPDFARLDPGDRLAVVKNLLANHRLLLIWDNFETVRSMPDPTGATGPLDEGECARIREFLGQVAGGRSTVVITSRTAEEWLGELRRIPVGGLARDEAAQYADLLLDPFRAAQRRRAERVFGELLEWLDGHPLSMRLILPRLADTDPATLLEELRGTVPLAGGQGDGGEGGRSTSLAASITYSYAHLSEETRRLLPVVSLFHGVADITTLRLISQVKYVPKRFAEIADELWEQALADAERVGLVTGLGAGMYRIHPALPGYLAAGWRADDPIGFEASRRSVTRALAESSALVAWWAFEQISSGKAHLALTVLGLQRRTLGAMLNYVLDQQMWDQALALAQPLDVYWQSRGLSEEANQWTDRILAATEDPAGTPPSLDTAAGALWLFITGAQANRYQRAMRLDDAEHAYSQTLDMLRAQDPSPQQQIRIAAAMHNLGVIAHSRGRLDDAQDWYSQSMAITQTSGDRSNLANSYHQLGRLAHDQRELVQAQEWYDRCLALREELGDRPGIADSYHQLGIVAQERGNLDQAQEWYDRCLALREELGDRPGIADSYHQLGMVAHLRGELNQAQEWYGRSLVIKEGLGNRPGAALSLGALGLVAEHRGDLGEALEWTIRSVTQLDPVPRSMTGPGPLQIARLVAQLGIEALQLSWQQVTGQPLPAAVRDYVTAGIRSQLMASRRIDDH